MTPTLAELAGRLLDIQLTAEQEAQFTTYARELQIWNERTNLTAITGDAEIRVRHFLDSLTVARATPLTPGLRLIDVGSGAGFPGLPLAIAFPQLSVTLLEATGKKIAFLDHMIATLGLQNVTTVNLRAEEAGQDSRHRENYDVAVARAVARLPSLLEYLLPLTSIGGVCIAMKGRTAREEARDSARALSVLGGQLLEIASVQLPEVDEPHHLIVVRKVKATPAGYPRKPGIPTRKPLV
ncbi:MAG: 16S rRNA (guanine(527)-N(7))-methyltransferase RsmG [Chloroflexota bacterium]|nr:MAG: 16S rRNA (guanine(527)-N(7))-methyltransferase RsmG [Chloroflexota bacterium]